MSYPKFAALTAALALLAVALVAGRATGQAGTHHSPNFIAQHTNAILRHKCRTTYKSLRGDYTTWLRRHLRAHKASRGRCTPVSRARTAPAVDGCLGSLIQRESGWDVHAENSRTHAYGLPQALPASKMASAGPDWRDSAATQIRWMLGYIAGRYHGSTCEALNFQIANGWY